MNKAYETPVSELLLILLENNFAASGNICNECGESGCPNYKNQSR